MWREAMRRRRYLRDRAEAAAAAGGGDGLQRSRDWLYESYYCMSQQHPLIVFLLLIVMGACLALLAVFFALRLVSGLPAGPAPRCPGPETRGTQPGEPRPAGGGPSARSSRPLLPARGRPGSQGLRAREKFPWKVLPKIKLPGCSPGGRTGRVPSPALRTRWRSPARLPAGAAACNICSRSDHPAASRGHCTAPEQAL